LDYDQKLDVDIQTEIVDVSTLPSGVRETSRMLLKFITIANYEIDADLSITLYYKQDNSSFENQLTYNVSKDDERFKQKLPAGINARQFRVRVFGSQLTRLEINKISVLWIQRRIGDR